MCWQDKIKAFDKYLSQTIFESLVIAEMVEDKKINRWGKEKINLKM